MPSEKNIGRVDDPSYRYKRPIIQSKTEGRGNGIKTVIENMVDVANALHRKPADITKFFGCEFGAQSRYDEATQKSSVNGLHDNGKLEEWLDNYIDKFVLCPKCHLPETELKIKKEVIYHKCMCCGTKSPLVDPGHKLCTTMLKDEKNKKKERGDKEKKEKKTKVKTPTPKDVEGGGEVEKPKKSTTPREIKEETNNNNEEEDDDNEIDNDNGDGTMDNDAIKIASETLAETIKTGDIEQINDKINSLNLSVGMSIKFGKLLLLFEAVYDVLSTTAKTIIESGNNDLLKELFQKYMKNDEAGSKLFACIERYMKLHPDKSKLIPVILRALYNNEVLSERQILGWNETSNTLGLIEYVTEDDIKKTKEAASPMIMWLMEAEAEE